MRRTGGEGLTGPAIVAALALGGLSGCAGYAGRPLPTGPDVGGLQSLRVDVSQLRLQPLQSVRIDLRRGIDPVQAGVLAVLNSPDLRAKREAARVKGVQVFAAGLLPEPQITLSTDRPISGPDHQEAFLLSPSLDIAAWLARSSTLGAARYSARQADLDVLWAEWTTAQQARELAETALADEARAGALRLITQATAERAARSRHALAQHDVTATTAAADLTAKLDAEAQLATVLAAAAKARRDLNALLNLDPAIRLPLVAGSAPTILSPAQLSSALESLPRRRPDLLALRAGYGAQDANLRKAVIAQFPLANVALNYAKDPAGTTTLGLAAVLAAPIFGARRTDVRIQEATREQLRAEYLARLDQAAADVGDASAVVGGARANLTALQSSVPELEALIRPALAAYDRGDIDSLAYLTLVQSLLSRRADLDDRALSVRIAEIKLETALFLPPADLRGRP